MADAALPFWVAQIPDPSKLPAAGLPTPLNGVNHTLVYRAGATFGAYNHGPIITQHNGAFLLSWYNGEMDESAANRVLFSVSNDSSAVTWSPPRVLFNTTAGWHKNSSNLTFPKGYNIGNENEPWLVGASGALYGVASSWDVFQRRGHGAEHVGPDAAVVRKVRLGAGSASGDISAAKLGEVFWLADAVPAGFEAYCNVTYRDAKIIGSEATDDLTRLRARLISTVPSVDAGEPNERSVYSLPRRSSKGESGTSKGGGEAIDLVLLMRSGNDTLPRMWASTRRCEARAQRTDASKEGTNEGTSEATTNVGTTIEDALPTAAATVHRDSTSGELGAQCRPGTGVYNFALLPEVAGGWSGCTAWTRPKPTNIPDSHSRTCAAALADGRRWLVGAQLPKSGDRTPLTLALSRDGLSWDRVWNLRGSDTLPPIRYHGYPGFQYPSGMPTADGRLLVAYSVNKEDIAVTSVHVKDL